MCMRLRKGSKSDTQRTSPEGMFRFISSDGNSPPSGTARGAGIFISGVPVRFAFSVSVLLFDSPVNATMEQVAVAAGHGYCHSSSLSLRTASLSGFFDLSLVFDGPLRYGASTRFETMPSSPCGRHA